MKYIIVVPFLCYFMFTTLSLLYEVGEEYYFLHQSRNWIETKASVFDAKINVIKDISGGNPRYGGKTNSYNPNIHYGYFVNGKEYSGTRLDFASERLAHSESYLNDSVSKLILNQAIYYNPLNPSESVVLRQVGSKVGLRLFFGIFFGVFACPLLLYGFYMELITPAED